ncbi:MAG TPA: hypothetical protein VFF69_02655 [Phycisphaerales bacterium]|nr:hypothetical protein [Phycisphaerales bacterium]
METVGTRKRASQRIGERHGRWTIVGVAGYHRFLCVCQCGTEQPVARCNLLAGNTRQCRRCQAAQTRRRAEERAAAMVGAQWGTLTIVDWRRASDRLQLQWRCECGRSGWTSKVRTRGSGCPSCAQRASVRERAAIRHRGVGYTFTDLAERIGVSRQRVTEIYRDRGEQELLRRAGLLKSRGKRTA